MFVFYDTSTDARIYSPVQEGESNVVHVGNKIEIEDKGMIKLFRIVDIVIPYKNSFFGLSATGYTRVYLEPVSDDLQSKNRLERLVDHG